MKKTCLITLLILMVSTAFAQTQRFPRAASFGTNVFLHDSTTPLHERVPTGTVVTAITSTNGSATITTNGSSIDISVPTNASVTQTTSLTVSNAQGVFVINELDADPYDADVPLALKYVPVGSYPARSLFAAGGASFITKQSDSSYNPATVTNQLITFGLNGSSPYVDLKAYHDPIYPHTTITYRITIGTAGFLNIERTPPADSFVYQGGIRFDASNLTNFPASLLGVAAFNAWSTNAAKVFYSSTPTNGQTGARGETHVNTTNLVLFLGDTNKFVLTGVLNP